MFSKQSCEKWPSNYDFSVAVDILHDHLLNANIVSIPPNSCGHTCLSEGANDDDNDDDDVAGGGYKAGWLVSLQLWLGPETSR